ncbi:hypothetical protein AB0H51_07250 [Streptomyces griseoluteus]|uniref:hypothetical protein n=1 Tax=Streptomyces griseoluteus TaxID=29306 RepID=UPI0033CAF715
MTLLLTPTAPGASCGAQFSDTALALLVSEGEAPAAALPAQDLRGDVVPQLATEQRLSDTVEQNLPGLLPRLRSWTRHSGEESGPTPRTPPTRTSRITDWADSVGTSADRRLEPALVAAEFCPCPP